MKFGNDLWGWLRFVIGLIKLLKEIFGDAEDKEDLKRNCKVVDEVNNHT